MYPTRVSEEREPKVAVVGAGRWGWNLARNLRDMGVLTAVADGDPGVRARVGAELDGVASFQSLEEVLASDVDAVVIATPAPTHAELATRSLRAGKHVLVEKPFTLTIEDAEAVVREAKTAGRILMVGHLLLYQPAILWLKDFLSSGAIGRVASLYQDRLNLGTVRKAENSLWSLGVHDIAAILFLVGELPVRVDAWGQDITQRGVQDDMHLHMEFPSGVEGHIHNSWLWPERRRRLTIVGTAGMVVYDESDQCVRLHRRYVNPDLSVADDGEELLFVGDGQPLRRELEHFVECICTGAEPRSSGLGAVEVVGVLAMADEQLREMQS